MSEAQNSERRALAEWVDALPPREGSKPRTVGPAPHQQLSQYPATIGYADQLDTYLKTFVGIENGPSHIGDGGLRAYFIAGDTTRGFSDRFLVDNEFAHIHRHDSHSLHLVLPPEIGTVTDRKGWTENHPLAKAGNIPATNHMLFGARNEEEEVVSGLLLRIAYLYASRKW